MEDENKLIGFRIQSRGYIRLDWKRPNGTTFYTRKGRRQLEEHLTKLCLLDVSNMPEGTHVEFNAGKVTSNNRFGIVGSGRKPIGKRAMTNAERQAAYRARKRE